MSAIWQIRLNDMCSVVTIAIITAAFSLSS